MRHLNLKLIAVGVFVLLLLCVPDCWAAYVIDADLSDWGVTPFVNWVPAGTADFNETDNANLYGAMGYSEYYDYEALYFDDDAQNFYFAIVTSHNIDGDLGIDLDNNFTLSTHGIMSGLEYAVRIGSGSGEVVANPTWSKTTYHQWPDGWQGTPHQASGGTILGLATVAIKHYAAMEQGTYIVEISVPRHFFPYCYTPGHPVTSHHTMWCGNDSINLTGDIAKPEGPLQEIEIVKWSQPPVPWEEPGIYVGWDEESHNWLPRMVADDFRCDSNDPLVAIRWWGSLLGYYDDVVPVRELPDAFYITIWNDIPAEQPEPQTKWIQEPDLSPNGIDVDATWEEEMPQILADDFECKEFGPITDIHIWGSWKDDYLPYGYDPMAVIFTLSIHDNIPADPGNPESYSMPGPLLWIRDFWPGEFDVNLYAEGPEDWYNPCTGMYFPNNHSLAWKYDFYIDRHEAFFQEGDPLNPVIYWLDVQASPMDPEARFGWKTSIDHWEDDAVWAVGGEQGHDPWNELRYPEGHKFCPNSIDLAFAITTSEDPGYSHPNEIIWDNYCPTYDVNFYGWELDEHAKFQFYQELDPCDWWYQPGDQAIYWLGIMAIYNDNEPNFPWGWETRTHYFMDDAVRFFGYPEPGIQYPAEDFEPITLEGKTWDLSFELISKKLPKPPVPHLKWSQPPIENLTCRTPIYCGWDEVSYNKDYENPSGPWRIVADDFRCLGTMPIESIHWWGSHFGWEDPLRMPPQSSLPVDWWIGFWSNVPAGAGVPYSYPETLLHDFIVPASRVEIDQVGKDQYHSYYYPNDVCYQYHLDLEPEEVFWQHKFEPNTVDDIFWLSIVALYPEPCEPPLYPWGWKTRPWSWMDDAVRFSLDGKPQQGINLGPGMFTPIEDPILQESFDVAFELDTDPNYIKWEQAYDSIRHWPHYHDELSMAALGPATTKWEQLPDLSGWDVAFRTIMGPTHELADDWQCTKTGPVSDIRFWVSWQYEQEGNIPWIDVKIYSDNPKGAGGHSEPNQLLWQQGFDASQFIVSPYAWYEQGWFDPVSGMWNHPDHSGCYLIDIDDIDSPFIQEEDNIYWLSIEIAANDGEVGWKTSEVQWNDDAVYWETNGSWHELHDPCNPEKSLDLAFVITTEKEEPELICLVADDWPCDQNTPITAIVWWGSYLDYEYEACNFDGTGPPLPVKPDYFRLNIWTDVPADSCVPGSFSHPNEIIWQYDTRDYDEVLVGYDKHPEGSTMPGHEPVFRYSVRLPQEDWFLQEDGNNIYWLSVVAVYDENTPNYEWGWTNHEHVYQDDAVEGYFVGDTLQWRELYDQTGASEDMSFILFTEPGCFPCAHPDYFEWLSVDKPNCWCYPRQCHADADGLMEGSNKEGYWYVGTNDLNVLLAGWKILEPNDGSPWPGGPGIASIPNGICADFAHDIEGSDKEGYWRVGTNDLNILLTNWKVLEPNDGNPWPGGPGVDPNCMDY